MQNRNQRRPGRRNDGGDVLRIGVLLYILFLDSSITFGFETNHRRLSSQVDRISNRAVSTSTTTSICIRSSVFSCQSKIRRKSDRWSSQNGSIFSSPLPVNSFMALSPSSSASNNYVPMEASTSWEDVLSSQPSSSPLTSQGPGTYSSRHTSVTTYDKVVLASFTGLAAMTVVVLLMYSSPGAWRYFLAGGICAATSHAIPTPVDVVKTRKQVDASLADKPFLVAAQTIVREEGIRALLAGLGPTYWGYLLEGAIKFGVYEILKPIVKSGLGKIASISPSLALANSQLLGFILCAVVSGLSASFVLCPMEALRIRMVAEPSFAKDGWIHGGYRILKEEGVTGLAKGMSAMIFKQVPYTVTKNVSFDVLARLFYTMLRSSGTAISGTVSFAIPLIAAASASVLSSITSQPGDMVLSLVNAHEGEQKSSDIVRKILHSERGIGGFFVGFKTRLLHVGITVTIQLLIYDYIKRLCGVAATGSL